MQSLSVRCKDCYEMGMLEFHQGFEMQQEVYSINAFVPSNDDLSSAVQTITDRYLIHILTRQYS